MNQDVKLKLQAFGDGELSGREAEAVRALLERDAEARQLLDELKVTTAVLRENEPQHALPESPEFYWSKIERAIAQTSPEPVSPLVAFWFAFRRGMAPITGFALVLLLGVISLKFQGGSNSLSHLAEVESLSEHVTSFSFRSQSENMFVVWLSEKGEQQPEPTPEDMEFDDEILQ